jgi:DNA processing protein
VKPSSVLSKTGYTRTYVREGLIDVDDATRAHLIALAFRASPHLGDRHVQEIADAFELHCDAVISADLSPLNGGPHLASARTATTRDDIERWLRRLAALSADGARTIVLCEDSYPLNLRLVHDRPPVLFVRGRFDADDTRAVAVVGTREPTDIGRTAAMHLATELAQRGVTVVSGLAAGIDSAAHAAALSAGGRTIAVLGQGIVPPISGDRGVLARAIARSGAVVSQFWPDQKPTSWTYPLRNRTTSGLSLATIVVEAGPTSGAKLQALDALHHGRRVFLLDRLVMQQEWARELANDPAVTVLADVDQVIHAIEADLLDDADALV